MEHKHEKVENEITNAKPVALMPVVCPSVDIAIPVVIIAETRQTL